MRLTKVDAADRELYLDVVSEFSGEKVELNLEDYLDSKFMMAIVGAVEKTKPLHVANKDTGLVDALESEDLKEAVAAKSHIILDKKYLHLAEELIHKDVADAQINGERIQEVIEFLNELVRPVKTNDNEIVAEPKIPYNGEIERMISNLNQVLTSNYFKLENV